MFSRGPNSEPDHMTRLCTARARVLLRVLQRMTHRLHTPARVALAAIGAVLVASCASTPAPGNPANDETASGVSNASPSAHVQSAAGSRLTPAEMARRDGGRPPYTRADVEFMAGMIGHHAQAVTMARWAPTHGASSSLQILAERIAVAQEDEIAFMQTWLADRGEPGAGDTLSADARAAAAHAAASHAGHAGTSSSGADSASQVQHDLMPGMLTAAEFAQLDKARGTEFDRLFLTFMIRHHEGALVMVDKLLASPGAAQDDEVYRFVADVNVDQDTEIARMTQMLESMRASP